MSNSRFIQISVQNHQLYKTDEMSWKKYSVHTRGILFCVCVFAPLIGRLFCCHLGPFSSQTDLPLSLLFYSIVLHHQKTDPLASVPENTIVCKFSTCFFCNSRLVFRGTVPKADTDWVFILWNREKKHILFKCGTIDVWKYLISFISPIISPPLPSPPPLFFFNRNLLPLDWTTSVTFWTSWHALPF